MSSSRVDIKMGTFVFTAEGTEAWVSAQLEKVLEKWELLNNGSNADEPSDDDLGGNIPKPLQKRVGSLASYIKTAGGESNQVKRFLATAIWLHDRGSDVLETNHVTQALKTGHQKSLKNPADKLNKNVQKGHCEKSGSGFFVTPDGRKEVGLVNDES